MRLWTVHPRYLDTAGLVALWREGLLARKVLQNRTRGYRSHPQLSRFRARPDPISCIDSYLAAVYEEAAARGYSFDRTKLGRRRAVARMAETSGQLACEWRHLKRKLRTRNPSLLRKLSKIRSPEPHPLFRIVPGAVRSWERARDHHRRGTISLRSASR